MSPGHGHLEKDILKGTVGANCRCLVGLSTSKGAMAAGRVKRGNMTSDTGLWMQLQVIQEALEGSEPTRNIMYFMPQEDPSRRSGSQPGDI